MDFTTDPLAIDHLEQPRKKTWKELQRIVRSCRNAAATYNSRVPSSFTFHSHSANNEKCFRVFFLAPPQPSSRCNSILYVDLQPFTTLRQEGENWTDLLEDLQITYKQKLSKQEELLRERKRLLGLGISAYETDCQGRFVFTTSGSLFHIDDSSSLQQDKSATQVCQWIKPRLQEVAADLSGTKMDAKLCPWDPNVVSFVYGGELLVCNVKSGFPQQISSAAKRLANGDLVQSAGIPSFVMQEEFDRYTAHWWQPKPDVNSKTYRVLYEVVDEANVSVVTLRSRGCSEDQRYPLAGETNAESMFHIAEFQLDASGKLSQVSDREIFHSALSYDSEYVIRAGWTNEGTYAWLLVLNRLQTILSLFLFSPKSEGEPLCTTVLDTSEAWINVTDAMYFLPANDPNKVEFIWASEQSGFRHLYLSEIGLTTGALLTRPLTSGQWMVMSTEVWVDTFRSLVYFMANKSCVLETHLYVVSYKSPHEIIQLTKPDYSHTVFMNKECDVFVTVNCSLQSPQACQAFTLVYTASGTLPRAQLLTVLQEQRNFSLPSPSPDVPSHEPPELFEFPCSGLHGLPMYGLVFPPRVADLSQPCPTVLVVYGGPQVQTVTNTFKGNRYLRYHNWASLGYTVVMIDSRGTNNRSLVFERQLQNKLGQVELQDQVEGLLWLAQHKPYIDLKRVAIHGWSYGGYLSLMALIQYPEVFKISIAGAPVTAWELYDTGYTERYIGLPGDNPEAYHRGSVLKKAHLLPDQSNRLLIVHGVADDNVHFYHTSELIECIIAAGKPYQLQIYPEERHGIRNPEAHEHYETLMLHFLEEHL